MVGVPTGRLPWRHLPIGDVLLRRAVLQSAPVATIAPMDLMKTTLTPLIAAAGLVGVVAANASVITFETAPSTAGPLASADDYRSVVNAAMTKPGAQSAVVGIYDGLSSLVVFGGSSSDLAFRTTVNFNVASAGSWDLRAGVDFGRGGAIYLDGVALAFKATDMWWDASYADATQSFQLNGLALSAGAHTLQLFGLESCCDGAQQAQYRMSGGEFKTFAANDGLSAAVPEPEACVLMLAGLGAMVLRSRRRETD